MAETRAIGWSTRRTLLVVALIGVLSMSVWHYLKPRHTPGRLVRQPLAELQAFNVTREGVVYQPAREHWAGLLTHLGGLSDAYDTWEPARGGNSRQVACIEMDWQKRGRVWLRLMVSDRVESWSFAWLETPRDDDGIDNHGGPYDGRAMTAWLDALLAVDAAVGPQRPGFGCR